MESLMISRDKGVMDGSKLYLLIAPLEYTDNDDICSAGFRLLRLPAECFVRLHCSTGNRENDYNAVHSRKILHRSVLY